MNSVSYFLFYWAICLIFWWILPGKRLSNRFAFLGDRDDHYNRIHKQSPALAREERKCDDSERRMIVFLCVVDIFTAPVLVPLDLGRRAVNGLIDQYRYKTNNE